MWADSPDHSVRDRSTGRQAAVEARKAYDVWHHAPWGWKVAAYLWTKSIAAGVPLVAALLLIAGFSSRSALLDWGAPLVGAISTAVTAVLLIADLKRPDRFHYLLLKGNPDSWLVRGAYILQVYGVFLALWFIAGIFGVGAAFPPLWWLAGIMAIPAAGYTAFLFGQCEGRDFWQSPLFLWHLLAQAFVCGAAILAGLEVVGGAARNQVVPPAGVLLIALLANAALLLGELAQPHVNRDVGRALHEITRGRYARRFWLGAALCGLGLPLALLLAFLLVPAAPLQVLLAAGVLALAGVLIFEDIWVKAGQVVPLS
jgi:formate-dependent nitrite reductase membrane component NrfD